MKEDVFLKVGYSSYLQNVKKESGTSKFVRKFFKHKVAVSIITITVVCAILNCWMIYRFFYILQKSRIFF